MKISSTHLIDSTAQKFLETQSKYIAKTYGLFQSQYANKQM